MKKIKVTQQQRDNQLEARDVMWPSVPEANVYPGLKSWGYHAYSGLPSCGTVACFGGWAEAWPPFRNQLGLAVGKSATWGGLSSLFGPEDDFVSDQIFNVRGHHPADKGFKGTDHALVANRLDWIIENSVVA